MKELTYQNNRKNERFFMNKSNLNRYLYMLKGTLAKKDSSNSM